MSIKEGIYVTQDGDLEFNWKDDSKEKDSVFLKFGGNYHISRKRGETTFHICFRLNPKIDKDDKRTLLKQLGNYPPTDDNYKLFLSKASMGLSSSPVIDLKKVNVIITPESSKSLSYDLASVLKNKAGHIILYPRHLSKIDINQIKLDYDKIKQKKINKKVIDWLESILEKMTTRGEFKIKNILPRYRPLLTNFLKLSDEDRRLLNLINNGTVMIIDDYFTTGSTLQEAEKLLKSYGASEVILVAAVG